MWKLYTLEICFTPQNGYKGESACPVPGLMDRPVRYIVYNGCLRYTYIIYSSITYLS